MVNTIIGDIYHRNIWKRLEIYPTWRKGGRPSLKNWECGKNSNLILESSGGGDYIHIIGLHLLFSEGGGDLEGLRETYRDPASEGDLLRLLP
jgi:hypothetical protein